MGDKVKKVKILFTTSNFHTAGSGKVIYDLVNGLDKSKFEIEIACGNDKGDFFRTVESLGLPIHIFQTMSKYRPYSTLLLRVQKIAKFYKQNKYDIIHSWQWSSDWTEALAAKMAGVKWIYTKKAMGFNNIHWKIRSYLANFIITINHEMQAYFPFKKQQALIPLGIDTDFYNSYLFKPKNPSDIDGFHIITVANLVPVKGIQILIKAVHLLNDKSIRLTVLGDYNNDYGGKLKALSKELDMQVSFVGKQLDVRPFLAAADLYVIPTLDEGRKEGMPMALVEAMAMGIPVLGSNISGINYVLKDFPELLFEASNIKQLSSKIEMLYHKSYEERLLIGKSLRNYCETYFSMEVFINAHEELYKSMIGME